MYNIIKWDAIDEALKESYSEKMYEMLFLNVTPIFLSNDKVVIEVDDRAYIFLKDRDTTNYKKMQFIIEIHTSDGVEILISKSSEKKKNIDTNTKLDFKQEEIKENKYEWENELIVNNKKESIFDKIPNNIFEDEEVQRPRKKELPNQEYFKQEEILLTDDGVTIEEVNIVEEVIPNNIKPKEEFNSNLKANLTFDNFFYSFENKKVIKACSIIIDTFESPKFNPLFIYGNSGIGKTHLSNAVGNEILNKFPNKKILYVTATKFLEEYTNLFKGGLNNIDAADYFKEKYYNIDLLIFDDIQILEGKESTLNEFFSIFEKLMFNEKMVIITSDKHPEEISFEERLISRFLSGVTLELRVPDSDTKKQIFNHHIIKENFTVTEKATQIFIENSQNVRALLGYTNAMVLFSINGDVDDGKFDVEHAQEIVNNQSRNTNNLTPEKIITIIVDHFEITKEDIHKKSRKQHIVKARQFIAYFLYEKLKINYVDIARYIGLKEHSSALRSVRKIKNEHNQVKYKDDFIRLSKKIN